MFPSLDYFEQLRDKINKQLMKLVDRGIINEDQSRNADQQINEFCWLFGALGKIPADAMLICENPSIRGIEEAQIDTIDGGKPDIEAQWWGGNAGTCFRPALNQLGLKTTKPNERGGWNCYITNVIKQADYANIQGNRTRAEKRKQSLIWVDILKWEMDRVKPKILFCMGRTAFYLVKFLMKNKEIDEIPFCYVMHYSAWKSNKIIINSITIAVEECMNKNHITLPINNV